MKTITLNKILYTILFFATTLISPCQSQVPQNGLVGWWPFNANANDKSGNGNNGNVIGASLTTDRHGNVDSAYSFDGQTNYIRIINSNSLNSKSVSISGWFNPNVLSTNDYLGAMGIIGKWWQQPSNCNANYNAYLICLTKPSFQTTTFLGGATSFYAGNKFYDKIPISINQWYHFVFIHDSSTGGKLYINGNLVSTNNSVGVICNSLNDIIIGADVNNGSIYRFFNGKLDDFGVWNRALTDTEVQQLYNSQKLLDETPKSVTEKQPQTPKESISSLSSDEKKGMLGIILKKINPELIKEKELKTDSGILVEKFAENSPAEHNGVKTNDVIRFIDGKECIENEDITNYLFNKTAGETVKLIINRYGSIIEIPIILRGRTLEERISLYKKNALEKFSKEDYDGCIINCNKILEFELDNYTAIGLIALSNLSTSRFKESLEGTNRYINLKSKDEKYINGLPEIYACRGLAKFELKSYEDGCSDARIAISLGFKGSNVQKVIKLCEDSELITTLQKSGIDKYDKRDYVGSINDFSKILEIKPENYLALGLRAISRGLISDNNGAIEDINHYINIKSEDNDYLRLLPNLYSVRGVAYSQLNSIDKACEDFNKAISMGLNGDALKTVNEKIKLCKEYELLNNEGNLKNGKFSKNKQIVSKGRQSFGRGGDDESKSMNESKEPLIKEKRRPAPIVKRNSKPIIISCTNFIDNSEKYIGRTIMMEVGYASGNNGLNGLRKMQYDNYEQLFSLDLGFTEENETYNTRVVDCGGGSTFYIRIPKSIHSQLPNIGSSGYFKIGGVVKNSNTIVIIAGSR